MTDPHSYESRTRYAAGSGESKMGEKRKVRVDLDELSFAFEIQMMEANNYLDLETGRSSW